MPLRATRASESVIRSRQVHVRDDGDAEQRHEEDRDEEARDAELAREREQRLERAWRPGASSAAGVRQSWA